MTKRPPPREINITLTRDDILADVHKLMEDMSVIRFKCINDRKQSEENVREYIQLSNLLATSIMGVSNAHTKKKLETLVGHMNRNDSLVMFDPLQKRYWQHHEPEFLSLVDNLVIQLYGSNFNSLDKGHHLVSAIKMFCARHEKVTAEREKIVTSIRPVNGHVRTADPAALFTTHGLTSSARADNLTMDFNIGSIYDYVKNTIVIARDLGYLTISAQLPRRDYQRLQQELPGIIPTGRERGGEIVQFQIPVNKAPKKPTTINADRILRSYAQNYSLVQLISQYAPSALENFNFEFDTNAFKKELVNKYTRVFNMVDSEKLKETDPLKLIEELRKITRVIYCNPDTYGFFVGDKIMGDAKKVAADPDLSKEWGASSEGVITGICTDLAIRYTQAVLKGKRKNETVDLTAETRPPRVENMEPEYIKVTNETERERPEWEQDSWSKGSVVLQLGDLIKVKKSYDKDYDTTSDEATEEDADEEEEEGLNPGDICSGSKGQIVGYSYKIKFDKLVDAEGNIQESKTEEDILQYYLKRKDNNISCLVNRHLDEFIQEAIDKVTNSNQSLDLQMITHKKTKAYFNSETIEDYEKISILVEKEQMLYVLTYITEKTDEKSRESISERIKRTLKSIPGLKDLINGGTDEESLVKLISEYAGTTRKMFEQVAIAINPVHITLHAYRKGNQIDYFEARR